MGKNIEDQPYFVLADKVWAGTAWDYPNLYVLTNETRTLRATIDRLTRERDWFKSFCNDMAEYDCGYPNEPCLAVHRSELGHGMCIGCKAREALRDAPALHTPTTGGQGEGGKHE